ncbi:hypothetical protein [Stenotrophomonas indicatrix]|uniref:hypothetical protein n=1 Tax=Stenotrophomonas indicatrix TaxID=2045451 RepID=UPI0010C583C4|nr:hypothetical protein [Stenotrophomonas indicatrix]MBH1873531.1 hypothetical protein [Stenotrophomonas maltophilia]QBR44120.1 hypothetical protein DAIF1_16830 [Stenotrophomonas indicatrix]
MSDHASKFEELLKADTARMSLEFIAYGAVIGFIVGAAAVLIFQDMLKAVMS